MDYNKELLVKILCKEQLIRDVIYNQTHKLSIRYVQQNCSELENSYPIHRIKKYKQANSLCWLLKHKHHSLLKYKLGRNETVQSKCDLYEIASVKDIKLLDELYKRYQYFFQSGMSMETTAEYGNLYLMKILVNQTEPHIYPTKFILEKAIIKGGSNELFRYIINSLQQAQHIPFNIFEKIIFNAPKDEVPRVLEILFKEIMLNRKVIVTIPKKVTSVSLAFLLYCSPEVIELVLTRPEYRKNIHLKTEGIRNLVQYIIRSQFELLDDHPIYFLKPSYKKTYNVPNIQMYHIDMIYRLMLELHISTFDTKFKIQQHLNKYFINISAYSLYIQILMHLLEISLVLDLQPLRNAAIIDKSSLIKHLIIELNNTNNNLDSNKTIDYLLNYETRIYTDTIASVFDNICAHGTLDQVKYTHNIIGTGKESIGRASYIAMDSAVHRGDLEIIKFLHLNRYEQCSQMIWHRISNSKEVIQYLIESKPSLKQRIIEKKDMFLTFNWDILQYIESLTSTGSSKKFGHPIVLSGAIIHQLFEEYHSSHAIRLIDYYNKADKLDGVSFYHLFAKVCEMGDLSTLEYLDSIHKEQIYHPAGLKLSIADIAYLNGHTQLAEYIITNRKERFGEESWKSLGEIGDVDQLKLIERGYKETNTIPILKIQEYALRNANSVLLEYIPDPMHIQCSSNFNLLNLKISIKTGKFTSISKYLSVFKSNLDVNLLRDLFYQSLVAKDIKIADLIKVEIEKLEDKDSSPPPLLSSIQIHHIIWDSWIYVVDYVYSLGLITEEFVTSPEYRYIQTSSTLKVKLHLEAKMGVSIPINVATHFYELNFIDYSQLNIWDHNNGTKIESTTTISKVFSNRLLLKMILDATKSNNKSQRMAEVSFKQLITVKDYRNLLLKKIETKDLVVNSSEFKEFYEVGDCEVIDAMINNYSHMLSDENDDLEKAVNANNLILLQKLFERGCYGHVTKIKPNVDTNSKSLHYILHNHPSINIFSDSMAKSVEHFNFYTRYFPNGPREPFRLNQDEYYHSVLNSYYYTRDMNIWCNLVRKNAGDLFNPKSLSAFQTSSLSYEILVYLFNNHPSLTKELFIIALCFPSKLSFLSYMLHKDPTKIPENIIDTASKLYGKKGERPNLNPKIFSLLNMFGDYNNLASTDAVDESKDKSLALYLLHSRTEGYSDEIYTQNQNINIQNYARRNLTIPPGPNSYVFKRPFNLKKAYFLSKVVNPLVPSRNFSNLYEHEKKGFIAFMLYLGSPYSVFTNSVDLKKYIYLVTDWHIKIKQYQSPISIHPNLGYGLEINQLIIQSNSSLYAGADTIPWDAALPVGVDIVIDQPYLEFLIQYVGKSLSKIWRNVHFILFKQQSLDLLKILHTHNITMQSAISRLFDGRELISSFKPEFIGGLLADWPRKQLKEFCLRLFEYVGQYSIFTLVPILNLDILSPPPETSDNVSSKSKKIDVEVGAQELKYAMIKGALLTYNLDMIKHLVQLFGTQLFKQYLNQTYNTKLISSHHIFKWMEKVSPSMFKEIVKVIQPDEALQRVLFDKVLNINRFDLFSTVYNSEFKIEPKLFDGSSHLKLNSYGISVLYHHGVITYKNIKDYLKLVDCDPKCKLLLRRIQLKRKEGF